MTLQDKLDDLAAEVRLPIQLTDHQMRSLGFTPHGDLIDSIRQQTLLSKVTPPEIRKYFEGRGVLRTKEPLWLPPDPSKGVLGRTVVPVLVDKVHYGLLWILDDEHQVQGALLDRVREVAKVIGEQVRDQETAENDRFALTRQLLQGNAERRNIAWTELVRARAVDSDDTLTAVVIRVRSAGGGTDRVPRHVLSYTHGSGLPHYVLRAVEGSAAALLVPGSRGDQALDRIAELGRSIVQDAVDPDATVYVGIGGQGHAGPSAWLSASQAARAADAAERFPELERVAAWDRLGSLRLLVSISEPDLRVLIDPRIITLHCDHRELLATVETYLDTGGDITSTCKALNVHRGTVYYRLRRVEELTGLSIRSGADRLTIHTGAKAVRLLGEDPLDGGRTGATSQGPTTSPSADEPHPPSPLWY
ncbi:MULTISPECIES: PucR family transcriptional regulator [unclassified Geodermatophilus]|uniref:PucR family transcriptional regulator n=1 Tax=unclassified Geodermatophilus TaxID=2637632 RepID=UPI003EEE8119